jgi:hypothetical protein
LDLADDLIGPTPVISESGRVELDDPEFLIEGDEAIAKNFEDRLRPLVAGVQFLLAPDVLGHVAAMNGHPEKCSAHAPDGLEGKFDEPLLGRAPEISLRTDGHPKRPWRCSAGAGLIEAFVKPGPTGQRRLAQRQIGDGPAPGQLPKSIIGQSNDIIRATQIAKETGDLPQDGEKLFA